MNDVSSVLRWLGEVELCQKNNLMSSGMILWGHGSWWQKQRSNGKIGKCQVNLNDLETMQVDDSAYIYILICVSHTPKRESSIYRFVSVV